MPLPLAYNSLAMQHSPNVTFPNPVRGFRTRGRPHLSSALSALRRGIGGANRPVLSLLERARGAGGTCLQQVPAPVFA